MFHRAHGPIDARSLAPPVFIFSNTGSWRDVRFLGLAAPGMQNLDSSRDLVAVWKTKDGKRFQNYEAKFTILNHQVISKKCIDDIKHGNPFSFNCPDVWREWVDKGVYHALKAPRSIAYRSPAEQLPEDSVSKAVIAEIVKYFGQNQYRFEACAAKIAEMMLPNIASMDLTRRVRDGGRDAIGKYRIGDGPSAVLVDFALEAKCYDGTNSVGVRDLSRLISRLRNRQFGVLVTTSHVGLQAYKEIKEDEHPIVIIAARDIANVLRKAGLHRDNELQKWLSSF